MPYAGWHEGARIRFPLFEAIFDALKTLITAVYLQPHESASDALKLKMEDR